MQDIIGEELTLVIINNKHSNTKPTILFCSAHTQWHMATKSPITKTYHFFYHFIEKNNYLKVDAISWYKSPTSLQ